MKHDSNVTSDATTCNANPIDESRDGVSGSALAPVTTRALPAKRAGGVPIRAPVAPTPDDSVSESNQPVPVKKRYVRRFFGTIWQSHTNALYDASFAHIASNKVYHQHFVVSTMNAYMTLLKCDYDNTAEWIDEGQLGFSEVVCQLDGVTKEKIASSLNDLLICLFLTTCAFFFTCFNFLERLFLAVMVETASIGLWVSVCLWLAMLLYLTFIYVNYSYHCWVIRRDRFGTSKHFMQAYFRFDRNAIFPYLK